MYSQSFRYSSKMFLLLALLILILAYVYFTRNHDYWSKRGVIHDTPIPLFGNHFRVFTTKNVTDVICEHYKKYPKERIVGYYRGRTPALIIRDPEIAKRLLTTDFSYFYNRGLGRDPEQEPLMLSVFRADGDTWKLLRQHTSPGYTKVKSMFPLMVQCAENLHTAIRKAAKTGSFNAFDLMARLAMDFIGACNFGVDLGSMNPENSVFDRLSVEKIVATSAMERFKRTLYDILPELRRYFVVWGKEFHNTTNMIVSAILEQRNSLPSGRNDFVDLLLELQKKGKIRGRSVEKLNPDNTPIEVEIEMGLKIFVANVFSFFVAGFGTSATTMSYALHELAFYPQLQKEIQNEIDEVMSKYDGKLSYDAISKMPKLTRAFKEALRMFPPAGLLYRVCMRKYTIPDTGVTIDPGVQIYIPAQALHMDEKYFERPEEFNPERFLPENESKIRKYVYMPFGEGPRSCIGTRLGEMLSLTGLAAFLRIASVSPCPATARHPRTDPRDDFMQSIAGDLPLALTLRDTDQNSP